MSGIGWPAGESLLQERGLGWPLSEAEMKAGPVTSGSVQIEVRSDDAAESETAAGGGRASVPSFAALRASAEGAVWWDALHADDEVTPAPVRGLFEPVSSVDIDSTDPVVVSRESALVVSVTAVEVDVIETVGDAGVLVTSAESVETGIAVGLETLDAEGSDGSARGPAQSTQFTEGQIRSDGPVSEVVSGAPATAPSVRHVDVRAPEWGAMAPAPALVGELGRMLSRSAPEGGPFVGSSTGGDVSGGPVALVGDTGPLHTTDRSTGPTDDDLAPAAHGIVVDRAAGSEPPSGVDAAGLRATTEGPGDISERIATENDGSLRHEAAPDPSGPAQNGGSFESATATAPVEASPAETAAGTEDSRGAGLEGADHESVSPMPTLVTAAGTDPAGEGQVAAGSAEGDRPTLAEILSGHLPASVDPGDAHVGGLSAADGGGVDDAGSVVKECGSFGAGARALADTGSTGEAEPTVNPGSTVEPGSTGVSGTTRDAGATQAAEATPDTEGSSDSAAARDTEASPNTLSAEAVTPANDIADVSRETSPPGDGASSQRYGESSSQTWEDPNARGGVESGLTDLPQEPREGVDAGQTSSAEPSDQGAPGRMDGSAGMYERTNGQGDPAVAAAPWTPQEEMNEQRLGGPTATSTGDISVDYDERERVDLVRSLPTFDDSTPLAAEVAEDARRRITLSGRPFPRPPHTRILTVANQKGGVGKTTTTVNLAAALAQAGLNVLVLDIDPQGNASTALGIDHHSDIPSLYDVVVEGMALRDVLQTCPDVPNLWCAPATIDLAGAEIELVSLVARETRLQKALTAYLEERAVAGESPIDYVFVDCPPSLSLLTVNAFVAAHEVLIPIQCEYYALEGLSQLLKHVELIRGHLNPELHVSTILLTMYDGRTRLSSQVADEVRAHFPEQVVKTTVPRSVRISEAPSHGQTVMTYDPASSGALSYLEAARELAEQVLSWDTVTTTEERV